jgi:hypothetical protein
MVTDTTFMPGGIVTVLLNIVAPPVPAGSGFKVVVFSEPKKRKVADKR